MGWQMTVVTPAPELWSMVNDPEGATESYRREGIKHIFTGHDWRRLNPIYLKCWNTGIGYILGGISRRVARSFGIEDEVGWFAQALKACRTIAPGDADVILASGSPFLSFRLARILSDRLKCPFVIDYRDLWSGDPHTPQLHSEAGLRNEKEILSQCSAVTIVSPSLADFVRQKFNLENRPFVVTNGYDPEEMEKVEPLSYDHFAIVYAGVFYPPDSSAKPIMACLKKLKSLRNDGKPSWRFHYYGHQNDHVQNEAERFGVEEYVSLHGLVTRPTALRAVRGADVAVVMISNQKEASLEYRGIVSGKVFDPIGLRTPILAIAPKSFDVCTVVDATGVGKCFCAEETDGMAAFLSHMMNESAATPEVPVQYSWPHIAADMNQILLRTIQTDAAPVRTTNG
jgi:glycosyltransferase involved in cell wall biosynthesis